MDEMSQSAVTIVTDDGESTVADARIDGDDLWLPEAALPGAIGWTLKPQGLCRDAVCVPLPHRREAAFARDRYVNVATFWRHTDRPYAHSTAGDIWVLGANARERADALLSLEAPDFALPDLDGNMHAMSDYRGRKVFLVTWASW